MNKLKTLCYISFGALLIAVMNGVKSLTSPDVRNDVTVVMGSEVIVEESVDEVAVFWVVTLVNWLKKSQPMVDSVDASIKANMSNFFIYRFSPFLIMMA